MIDVTPMAADTKSTTGDVNAKIPRQDKTSRVARSRRYRRSSKRDVGNNSSGTSHNRECVCGMGTACFGMTQAFRMLKDPRCHFVELPRHRKDPMVYKFEFRNNLRQSYLRELFLQNPSNEKLKEELSSTSVPKQRQYIALHHFHPTVVQAFYEKSRTSSQKQNHKVPITITEHELGELGMECREENRILSVGSTPTDGFYFTPSYSHKAAHSDLKELIQSIRSSHGNKDKSSTSSNERSEDRDASSTEIVTREHRSDSKSSSRIRLSKRRGIPTSIEITTPLSDVEYDSQAKPNPLSIEEKRIRRSTHGNNQLVRVDGNSISKKCANEINTSGITRIIPGSGDDHADDDFENVWYKSWRSAIESSLLSTTITKKDLCCISEGRDEVEGFNRSSVQSKREPFALRRSIGRPSVTVTPSAYFDIDKSMRGITSPILDRLSTVSTALAKMRVLVGADSFRLPTSPSRVQQQYYKTLQKWSQPPALLALSAADGTSSQYTAKSFMSRYGSSGNSINTENTFDEIDDDSVNTGAASSLSMVDYIGLSCQPIVWIYLYSSIATTTGFGLPAGLGESISALKGLPYLIVLVLAVLPNSTEADTGDSCCGSFLNMNIQTLSRITIALGLLILAGLAVYRGCVPNAKPILDYSANICRFVAASST